MLFENYTGGYDSCFIFSKLSMKKVLAYAFRILNEANTCKNQNASMTVGSHVTI
jgi:hypothetical protein